MHLRISPGGRWRGFCGWKTDWERDRSAGEYWRHHRDTGLSSGLQCQTESAVSRRHPQEDRKKGDRCGHPKSRTGSGSEKACRQVFARHAPASRHCTDDYGRTFSPDPGRTDERSRQPGRAGDAAAVFETERRRKNHSSCQPQPGRHCSTVRYDGGD